MINTLPTKSMISGNVAGGQGGFGSGRPVPKYVNKTHLAALDTFESPAVTSASMTTSQTTGPELIRLTALNFQPEEFNS